jgi:response regulator RpfG family c-di-GMP phosphodiesterase
MNDSVSQIILLSELYVGLRSTRRTNQALNHLRAMELIQSDFNVFFNPDIIKRFIRYQKEIEMAFDK